MEEENVQTYLTKYKISSLFEDLMSKVIKELPPDPLEFLIGKLQILHRRKKKELGPSQIPLARVPRHRIEITGTPAASRLPVTSKSPVSDRLSKSTSGLRPIKPKSSLSSSSASSLSKTTPTKTTPIKGSSTPRPVTSSGTRPSSKTPVSGSKIRMGILRPSSAGKPSSTRPSTAPSGGGKSIAKVSAIPRAGKTSAKGPTSSSSKLPSPDKVKSTTSLKKHAKPVESKGEDSAVSVRKREAKVEEIDEFFGDANKSSQKQFYVDSEEEESNIVHEVDSSDGLSDDIEYDKVPPSEEKLLLNIQDIKEKKFSRHSKKTHHAKLLLETRDSTPLSVGYHDETESTESESGTELLEDAETLRDEGVEVTRGKYATKPISVVTETQEVMFCAYCARALGKGSTISGTFSGLDFESASQVGSHASFPQWEARESERNQETSSEITLVSHDTWGGLAPPIPLQLPHSDEESEIRLPPPPPLQGQSWNSDDASSSSSSL